MALNFYWNDPTMATSAARGGVPGNPFNTGVNRFFYDHTLQVQAPRMGNLYGALMGLSLNDFTVTTLASGLTQATPTNDAARMVFLQLQSALNSAAAALGLANRIAASGTIDPPTAELALTIVQKAPKSAVQANPSMASLTNLLSVDPAVAMREAPRFIALSADSLAAGFAAVKPIKVRLSTMGWVFIAGAAGIIGIVAYRRYMQDRRAIRA